MVQVIEGIADVFLKTMKKKSSQRLKPNEPKNLHKCFKNVSRLWKVRGGKAKNFHVVSA